MIKVFKLSCLYSVLALVVHVGAFAKDSGMEVEGTAAMTSKLARLSIQVGAYNVVRGLNNDGDAVTAFGLEYQDIPRLPYGVQVVAGVLGTAEHDWFAYAGLMKEFDVYKNTSLALSFAPGYYDYGNDGENLDNDLEFKSQIGVDYEFSCKHRLGVSFSHISNASLGDRNPGVEILSLNYSVPLLTLGR